MPYNYQTEKAWLFTDEGQRAFIKVRDKVQSFLREAGAFKMSKGMLGTGDSWHQLAIIDRLVELEEIREVTRDYVLVQDRVFVSARG